MNLNPREISQMLAVFRDRERRQPASLITVPPRAFCVSCKSSRPVTDMHFIANTGLIKNVQDCLCHLCSVQYAKEAEKIVRVVCAGCKEVVHVMEPEKEPSGFEWKAGRCYHVAVCPICAKDPKLKSSTVVEMIAFFRVNNIPFE